MEATFLTLEQKARYNNFVASHPRGTFLQSWEWGEWQSTLGRTPTRILLTHEGEIGLSAQLLSMPTPFGPYLYCAYGPLLNPNLSANSQNSYLTVLIEALKESFPKALFLRVEPAQKLALGAAWKSAEYVQPPNMLTVDLKKSHEELLACMHRKTRYNIRLAGKNNLSVEVLKESTTDVINLITQTAKRQSYRGHSANYITDLVKFFSKARGELYVSCYLVRSMEKQPLAAAVMVDFGKTRTYVFGGSDYSKRHLMSPFLLQWQAMQDAKAKGLKLYDLGSAETASGKQAGFAHFKLGFGAEQIDLGGTWDLPFKHGAYLVYRSLRKLNRLLKHWLV